MSTPCTDLPLERAYVSTILRYPEAEHLGSSERLSGLDCTSITHARIVEAVHAVFSRPGGVVCEAEVATELERVGAKAAVEALRELAAAGIEIGLPSQQAKRLRALAAARRRREALLRAIAAIEAGNEDAEQEFLAEAGVGDAAPDSLRVETLCASAEKAFGALAEARENVKWRTGFPLIDNAIGGCPPGTLHVVGGRTGAGKSSYAQAIAMLQARNGLRVGIVSIEDADMVVGPRGLSHVSRINPECFYTGVFPRDFGAQMDIGLAELKNMNVFIAYCVGMPLQDVISAIRVLVARHGCNAIVIDYIQTIQMDPRVDRKVAVADAAKRLKRECAQAGCALTIVSQLNRPEKAKPFSEPYITDLKETGDLENGAEVITLLWKTSDDEKALAFGKVAKVKWSPKRPRFQIERNHDTGAVCGVSERAAEPPSEEHTFSRLPSESNGRRYGGRS